MYGDPAACAEPLTLTKDQSVFGIFSIITSERELARVPASLLSFIKSVILVHELYICGNRQIVYKNGRTRIWFMACPHPFASSLDEGLL